MRHLIHFTGIFLIIGIFLIGCDAVVDSESVVTKPSNPGIAGVTATQSTNSTTIVWFQGFEENTEGWFGTIVRVASGTDDITSAGGEYHAVIGSGAFTRWGGYSSTFPPFGYVTKVDVYLDMDVADGSDKRFDFSSAISDTGGGHRRDFIFNIGTYPSESGKWAASASNNVGWPADPGRNPIEITESGWYTLKHTFTANEDGVLEVTMEIVDSEGTVLGTWLLSDPSDIIGATVGGNRYGWFVGTRFDFDALAIDNSFIGNIINNPTTKDDCKKGGWQQYGFSNQGRCIQFVNTGKDSRK